MTINIIRHTPVALPSGICYGSSDVALADTWEADILKVTQSIQNSANTVVYSSPLVRCKLLAQALSNKVIIDDRLKELNFGDLELQPWDNLRSPEAEAWMNDYLNLRCPGGESYPELCERVNSFLTDLRATKHEESIIVTHAGIIRAMLVILRSITPQESFSTHIEYGEIIRLEIN
jgi:alpha-ribazole phosphatase